MIFTVTPNPALDRVIRVRQLEPDATNRIEEEIRYPGGKGIGVSRMLTHLGLYNTALGFAGGFRGAELEALLVGGGTQCDFVYIEGETRSNIAISESGTGRQYLLSSRGPVILKHEFLRLLEKVRSIERGSIVCMGGALPRGVPLDLYRLLCRELKQRGCTVFLDADGEPLREGLRGNPDAIKPNVRELGGLVDRKLMNLEEIRHAAREARAMGAGNVLVSMGPAGMYLLWGSREAVAIPPPVKAGNTVGAGDSAVAGFVGALTKGLGPEQALVQAVAAGSATVARPTPSFAEREEVEALVPHVRLFLPEEAASAVDHILHSGRRA